MDKPQNSDSIAVNAALSVWHSRTHPLISGGLTTLRTPVIASRS